MNDWRLAIGILSVLKVVSIDYGANDKEHANNGADDDDDLWPDHEGWCDLVFGEGVRFAKRRGGGFRGGSKEGRVDVEAGQR